MILHQLHAGYTVISYKREKLSTAQQCRGCSSSWAEAKLLSWIVWHGRKLSSHANIVTFLALLLLMLQMSAHYPQDKRVGEVAAPARRWWIAFRVGEPPAQIWCAKSDECEQTSCGRCNHMQRRVFEDLLWVAFAFKLVVPFHNARQRLSRRLKHLLNLTPFLDELLDNNCKLTLGCSFLVIFSRMSQYILYLRISVMQR